MSINSFSKYFSMTGWRIGWMVVPEAHVRRVERLVQNFFICAPHASQVAALAALDAGDELEANLAVYRANRALMLEGLPRAGFSRIAPPDGAFYIYADVSEMTGDSRALCGADPARGRGGGDARGSTSTRGAARGTLRFSYAGATADIAEGIARLAAWAGACGGAGRVGQEPLSARDHQPRRLGPSSARSAGFRRLPPVRPGAPAAPVRLRRRPCRRRRQGRAAAVSTGSGRRCRRWRPTTSARTAVTGLRTRSRARRCGGASASGTSTISDTGSSPRSITSPNGEAAAAAADAARASSAASGAGVAAARPPRERRRDFGRCLGFRRLVGGRLLRGPDPRARLRRLRPSGSAAVSAGVTPSCVGLAAATAAAALALAVGMPLAGGGGLGG